VAVAAAASVAVAVAMLPDADAPGADDPVPMVAAGDGGSQVNDDPDQLDLLKNPAVAALLRELEAEALRGRIAGEDADDRPGRRMPIQEEIDLRRDWDVVPVHDVEFLMPGGDLDGFRLDLRPRGRPLVRPGVVPVGGDGR
jgi:hypothetical protein